MHANKLLFELTKTRNSYARNECFFQNKNYVRNVLRESFALSTGIYLPNHLFSEIWNQVDFGLTNAETDLLYHIDDIYHDFAHKGSHKYKKNGKKSKRARRMCRFDIYD